MTVTLEENIRSL